MHTDDNLRVRWSPDPAGRHISGATIGLVLRFVREQGGHEALAGVLAGPGGGRSFEELADPKSWVSYDRAVALFEAAVEVSADPRAGRRIGEEMLRQHTGTPVEAVLRSLGSPGEVLRNIAAATSKFAAVSTMEAVEVADDHARVSAVALPGFVRHPVFCDYVAGQLSQVSVLFGLEPADVLEEECQARGDARCLYLVSWGERSGADVRVRELEGRLADLASRVEALQSTAAELVSAGAIDVVLSSIATRAGDAVRAQGYLLAVRAVEGGPVVVHHDGLAARQVEALVPGLLGEAGDRDPSHLVVDVASARRRYGRLMAIGPAGVPFLSTERRLLAAYAEMAAAALDGATALDEARRRAETTGLLLDLARSLANADDPSVVCARAAELVPSVIGCEKGAVFLWHEDVGELRVAALGGFGPTPPADLVAHVVRPPENAVFAGMLAEPGPVLARRGVGAAVASRAFDLFGVEAYGMVPVLAQGRFVGVVVAGWDDAPARCFDGELVERMTGLADQVAAAFSTAALIRDARHQALHDRLTGLANQALLADHVNRGVERCRRSGTSLAVLFCDLDGFKAINDALGHAAGDEILRLVADRLAGVTRGSDLVARLGGDEFVVVLDDADDERAAAVAGKLLEELRRPFAVAGAEVFARVSIGVAVCPRDGETFDALLGAADEAMYTAKRDGRNGYRTFSAPRGVRGWSVLDLDRDLVRAIESEQLAVHYQPEIHLATGGVVASEALVRWPHPVRGLMLPGEFLGMAADRGLIRDLDRFVIRRACADAVAWAAAGAPRPVAVNLSEFHFSAPEALVDLVESALCAAGLPPELLEIEIVETANLASSPPVLDALGELRSRGVRLCIDDFGTGYSILDRLRYLPVDKIKVAREFLDGAGGPLLETMVGLCRAIGAEAVAEGIETAEQLRVVRSSGFEIGQGYLLGRPAPVVVPDLAGAAAGR